MKATMIPLALFLSGSAALAGDAEFDAYARTTLEGLEVTASLHGADAGTFDVLAAPAGAGEQFLQDARKIASGVVQADGSGSATLVLGDETAFPAVALELRAAYLSDGIVALSPGEHLDFAGSVGEDCFRLDYDFAIGEIDPLAGQEIDDEWSVAGITISATNNTAGHPDKAIIFDSANVTGADFDLATPGYGPGNDEALGYLLIIAEDDFDGDGDGFVDDPDDEMFGGVIAFDFEYPVTVCRTTLIDVDDAESSELRFHFDGGGMDTIPVANMGDNSRQELFFFMEEVVRFEVVFGGSGGIADVDLIPCPLLINLDERPLGAPLDIQVGEWITDQFDFLGLDISAVNNTAGHPDKVILFDSENPTGGDTDLMTPGPGIGNDTPLGKVLIIAENDIDMDGDGYVDEPNDEGGGGQIFFDYDQDIEFHSATVLDVDASRNDFFAFYDSSMQLITTIQLQSLGDNSVQSIDPDPPIPGVRRVELNLAGSGAVTRLRWCPQEDKGGGE